jgi:amino acid transporter
MILAGIVGLFMALCWAELGVMFPVSGGDYSLVWHAFKGLSPMWAGLASFLTFSMLLNSIAVIPATLALGTGEYLEVIWHVQPQIAGALVTAAATLVAILRVRRAALITGVFLAVEMAVLAVVTTLGFAHWRRNPVEFITHPVMGTLNAGTHPVAFTTILSLTAVAVFAYNGYSFPVFYSEETVGHSRQIARAILISLGITAVTEIVPLLAVLVGSPSIEALATSSQPFAYFLLATSNPIVNAVVSLGIALAIFNAVAANIVAFGRIVFATGRDKAWPARINIWLARIHPSLRTPVAATAVVGLIGVILCLTVSLDFLVLLGGTSLVLNYAMVALAGLVGRATGSTSGSPYKMPGWPLPPLLALGALAYIIYEQTLTLWIATSMLTVIAVGYYFLYLWPRRGTAWQMLMPIVQQDVD